MVLSSMLFPCKRFAKVFANTGIALIVVVVRCFSLNMLLLHGVGVTHLQPRGNEHSSVCIFHEVFFRHVLTNVTLCHHV